ncbi:MAG TPA: type II CAAX endopeptidase family protein [Terriglobales bacterium]|nr:type II CAAX endopeptidase family protein [Terriglobales bacterium]
MNEAKPDTGFETSTNPPDPGQTNPRLAPASLPPTRGLFLGPEGLRPGWGIFLYLGMGVFLFLLLSSFGGLIPSRGAGYLWRGMFMQAVLAVSSLTPALAMARIEKRPFSVYGLAVRHAFGKLFWTGLLWGIVALSVLLLLMRGCGVFSYGTLALHGARVFKFAVFWGVSFLLVGVFEEFTFRGYTQFALSKGIGFWPAAFVLSFVFGGLHLLGNVGETWLGSLCAALIGLFFCFTLRRTGSLWFAVGMHASWDWAESYLYSVPDSGGMVPGHLLNSSFHGPRWLTGGSVGPEGSVLVFVVIAAAWVVFDRVYPKPEAA